MSGVQGGAVTTLGYHDVVAGDEDASGFPGADAGRYKLGWEHFGAHLDAIAAAVETVPVTAPDLLSGPVPPHSWSLTFDDGGASASAIAGELSSRGWRGQFFVTTERIGAPSFLDEDAIRQLVADGHVVGTHSHTHPQRMAACSREQLAFEWATSADRLEAVLGQRPVVGAVPGGWYSPDVARAAAASGIRALYTSEPTLAVRSVDGCLVLGRFALLRSSRARAAAALAAGRRMPRAERRARQLALAPIKRVSGDSYIRARAVLLRLRDR